MRRPTDSETVSLKALAKGRKFRSLPYLLTQSAHHLSQPLHLSKSSPLRLSNYPSVYLSLHPSAASYHPPTGDCSHLGQLFLLGTLLYIFFALKIHFVLAVFLSRAKLANLAARSRLLFHLRTPRPAGVL